jgi:hypothetical protein
MSKVIFRTALVAIVAAQAGCAPVYKGLWLDKVFDEPPAAFSASRQPYVVPRAPVPVAVPVVAAPRAPVVTSSSNRAALILAGDGSRDRDDARPTGPGPAPVANRQVASTGPGTTGPGTGPDQVTLGGGPSTFGSGPGPNQVAKSVRPTNRR